MNKKIMFLRNIFNNKEEVIYLRTSSFVINVMKAIFAQKIHCPCPECKRWNREC